MILVAVVLALKIAGWSRRNTDFDLYLAVGRAAMAGRDIFEGTGGNWPPVFSFLCVPLALIGMVSPVLAKAVWLLFSMALVYGIVVMLARLVYGENVRVRVLPRPKGLSLGSAAVAIPLLLTSRFILATFDHVQADIFNFALTLSGVYLIGSRRPLAGGGLIGVAAAVKLMPGIFIPYLVLRRRWAAAAGAVGGWAAATLAPAVVYGWDRNILFWREWRAQMPWGWGVNQLNQSMYAMCDRYLGGKGAPWSDAYLAKVVIFPSGEPVPFLATLAIIGALILAAVILFRGDEDPASPASLVEYSAVFLASALFCPLTWKSYLVVSLMAWMVLCGFLRRGILGRRAERAVKWFALAYILLSVLTPSGIVGSVLASRLESMSVVTIASLGLMVLLLWLRPRLSSR